MNAQIVSSFDALRAHADAWNQLAYAAPHRLPTLSYAWVASYLENLLTSQEKWYCILAFDRQELVGVLPIVVAPHKVLGNPLPRLRTPHNKHSFSVDFLSASGRESEVIPFLLKSLMEAQSRLYDFSLNRLPLVSPTMTAFDNVREGAIFVKEFDGAGSYLKLENTFEQYKKSLSRNFSRNLIKAKNKLARLPAVKTVFLSEGDATVDGLEHFMRIEASGWKARAGTAISQSPKLVAYYSSLVRRLSDLRWLEWHFLQTGDRIIAAQMGVKMGRALVILKIAYDEEMSYCSPGNLLLESTIERAYTSGDIDVIDCITDMPWHKNWKMEQRDYYNFWIYPRKPISWLLGALGRRARIGIRRLPILAPFYRQLKGYMKGDQK